MQRSRATAPAAHDRRPAGALVHGLLAVSTLLGSACAGGSGSTPVAEEPAPGDDGVITTESGLKYKVLRQGTGRRPLMGDRVLVHYSCSLTDGTVVDSSYQRGEPEVLVIRELVRGFQEALQLMRVGSHFRVAVPGELGYGERGVEGVVGPNEPLIFEIELQRIVRR
ncbi:MAG: FKBP-type peptidyl-prolyl cis-trans isomerase [Gemmatimonadota bacterium]|nr:FKBP-type peptidyl-prolyl cis-trans isomerase [Gemmatimonadota bacterium]MDE2985065.1 FKBP-type peptidyl-prolyl cis-trans isomerase [Gemmatimonadota bacterium]